MPLELYGGSGCPYTAELRDELEWKGETFVEYDVERDADARRRMSALAPGPAAIPVLVRDGVVVQVGHRGRSCYVAAIDTADA